MLPRCAVRWLSTRRLLIDVMNSAMLPNDVRPMHKLVLTLLLYVASCDVAFNGSPSDSLMCCKSMAMVKNVVDVLSSCLLVARVPALKMLLATLVRPDLLLRRQQRLRQLVHHRM